MPGRIGSSAVPSTKLPPRITIKVSQFRSFQARISQLIPGVGLISNHDYSILRAVEHKGKRFLRIRNPWAKSGWTGPWSDGSKEWTREATKEWRGVLDVLEHEFSDDGSFIMEYGDFLKVWSVVERTQLFDPTWIQSSHWLCVTSRVAPCAWQYGDVSCMPSCSLYRRTDHKLKYISHFQPVKGITRDNCSFPSRYTILERHFRSLVLVDGLSTFQARLRDCDRPILLPGFCTSKRDLSKGP